MRAISFPCQKSDRGTIIGLKLEKRTRPWFGIFYAIRSRRDSNLSLGSNRFCGHKPHAGPFVRGKMFWYMFSNLVNSLFSHFWAVSIFLIFAVFDDSREACILQVTWRKKCVKMTSDPSQFWRIILINQESERNQDFGKHGTDRPSIKKRRKLWAFYYETQNCHFVPTKRLCFLDEPKALN